MTRPKLEVGRLVMYRTKFNKEHYCLGLLTRLDKKGFTIEWVYSTPGYITPGVDKRTGPDTSTLEEWAKIFDEYIEENK